MNSQNAQKTAIELLQENVTARASTNHVVTYQLPVPLGDCSVHLQIFEHKVTSAFIMDGGKTAADVPAEYVIRESLELIRKLYFDNKPEGFLSAWVVTHWDEDHFQGVIKLIEDKTLVNKYFKPNKILYAGSDDFPLWKNVFDARTYLVSEHL
jgi:glyoxylase-like metal-dependent hydrolase (beta-lactamase superfamily II)